ncbi:MAG: aminotransferase class IV [Planctomycetota bacterium]|nr:aminotransferase class IV [Planctomycetota bacterium]MDA1177175.1 aminotransferase class IV [Planctomycetota bacterium]
MTINCPKAFLNGEWIDANQVLIPATDAGFMQGLTVAEQLRTFGGRIFRIEQHVARLQNSMSIVGVKTEYSATDLMDAATRLVAINHSTIDPADDLGLSIFVTPGPYAAFGETGKPLVGMHTYPLAFHSWADKYTTGQRMVIVDVCQVPETCWPAELKCRSRMHYFLADREASQKDAGARALLLDQAGWVSEASTANVFAYFAGTGLVAPPQEKTLPGISLAFVRELAMELDIPFVDRPMRPEELFRANEFFLCSTSPCILPVTRLNGQPIGTGSPGPMGVQLLQKWGEHVGLNLQDQAYRFRSRVA